MTYGATYSATLGHTTRVRDTTYRRNLRNRNRARYVFDRAGLAINCTTW